MSEIISKYANVEIDVAKKSPIVKYSLVGSNMDLKAYQKHSDLMFENKVINKQINVENLLLNIDEYR
ncbi:MAG: hypothetical protein IPK25_19355 [Saprospiraceae bacterium]|nr:hypothetical protein [Saprospiraceae bacterium]